MKISNIVAAAALAFAASQAGAVSVVSVTSAVGNATHQAFVDTSDIKFAGFTTYNVTDPGKAASPQGIGSFSVVSNSTATVTFSTGYTGNFTFQWGTPSAADTITSGSFSLSGSSALIGGANPVDFNTGNSQYEKFVTLGDLAGQTLTFRSTQAAFEVAAPVPEPETYALMLAGLGAIGWIARRRKSA